jgi:hypothetical protein
MNRGKFYQKRCGGARVRRCGGAAVRRSKNYFIFVFSAISIN